MEGGRAGRPLALQALVTFNAAVGRITELAFLPGDLDAVDAAVAGVDELQVVDVAVGERHTVGRVRTRTVREHREELLAGLSPYGTAHRGRSRDHERGAEQAGFRIQCHFLLLEEDQNPS
jgi:hypothetical protein